jgi:predicted NBD/HSP70 family sugar kinase
MAARSWQGTNLPRVGGFNRAVVLDAIRARGGISRVELAERTGLTAQTMSNIVRALIEDGLVVEDGQAPSTGGKRRVLLRVVPDAYSAIGLHLDPERITGVLLDLAGGVRLRCQRRVPAGASPNSVLGALTRAVRQLAKRSPSAVLGVGLAVPGPLDARQRQVLAPPNLDGWSEVSLADALQERVGMPVVMDNDATAAAIGERWAGAAGSFVYAHLGSGVGVGVVLGDQVYRGISNNAGEIGHVGTGGGGRTCRCGRRGCLEAYSSMRAVVEEWRAAEPDGADACESVSAQYELLCRRAGDGDAVATRVLRQAATRLGHALATVVSTLDVDHVVLGGPGLRHVEELVRSKVESVVGANAWAAHVRPVHVRHALVGEDAGAVGAASLVLDHAYSPRLAKLLGN